MKCAAWAVLFGAALSVLVYAASGTISRELAVTATVRAGEPAAEKPSGLPPLVVDRNAPLLLDAPPEESPSEPTQGPVADNTACYVCHSNYEKEEMVVVHAQADVGCIECHGECFAHRDDEDNVTPPDIMYARDMVEKACGECHEEHDVAATKVIVRWLERRAEEQDQSQVLCTDCHGQHRLPFRTVRWDKKTRRLLIRGEQRGFTAPDDSGKKNADVPQDQGFEQMR